MSPDGAAAASAASPRETGRDWVSPYVAILGCYLLSYATIQFAYPFVGLYLRDLGESEASAIAWSGAINAVLPGLIGLASAVWGSIGDRVGLKPMALRALVMASLVFAALSITHAAWQVLLLFIIYGLLASPPPALSALAAATLPLRRVSIGMGLVQTMQFVGVAIGPLLGVLAIGVVWFRGAFQGAALVMLLTLGLCAVWVREPLARRLRGAKLMGLGQSLAVVGRAARLRAPLVAIVLYQGAQSAGQSLMALYVQALSGNAAGVSNSVGVVLAASGLSTALGSLVMAWWSSRAGAGRIGLLSIVLAAVFTLPCAFVTDLALFTALRCVVGFFIGGVLPALQSVLIGAAARVATQVGTVQGLCQSAMWGGSAAGAALGATVATHFGLPAMFVLSALMMSAAAAWWGWEVHQTVSLSATPAPA
jgi:DHA1 family multidrug resistance protein-like MFS transporter